MRNMLMRRLRPVGLFLAVFLVWVVFLPLATIVWDYSRVPSREREYDRITLGMPEKEVIALLGPPYAEIARPGTGPKRWWPLNHYKDFSLEFDEQGLVVDKAAPSQSADQFPTLNKAHALFLAVRSACHKMKDDFQLAFGF
jgi:hypothetical protein